MTNQVRLLIGFNPEDITWIDVPSIIEIPTGGEDYEGFEQSETIGIAIDEDQYSLYRGSSRDGTGDYNTIWFSEQTDTLMLINALEQITNELKKLL